MAYGPEFCIKKRRGGSKVILWQVSILATDRKRQMSRPGKTSVQLGGPVCRHKLGVVTRKTAGFQAVKQNAKMWMSSSNLGVIA